MKRYSLLAFFAIIFFAACSNGTTSNASNTNATDSMAAGKTDTMRSEPAAPTSGNGNTAAGTSNAGVNLTDTAAVGTNRNAGRDTSRKMQDTPHRMKH
jgi:ABC-type Fe3+-hydroxamate transport system substrate-binding protein